MKLPKLLINTGFKLSLTFLVPISLVYPLKGEHSARVSYN